MNEFLQLAAGNLLSPMVLFFALGVAAGFLKSDLALPEAISKGLSLYLMLMKLCSKKRASTTTIRLLKATSSRI